MGITQVVKGLELGMEESQNQRDKRVEELWRKLDPHATGELDLKGLQTGLKKMDHRELSLGSPSATYPCVARKPFADLGAL